MLRVGTGFDIHRLEEGRTLVIGGVEVPYEKGCVGHSDGDALLHSISDALLGAAGLSDIGTLFPDTDETYKDIDSRVLLRVVNDKLREQDFEIVNIDCTVILQEPKLEEFKDLMKKEIADCLDIDPSQVGVKAKTAEKMLGELGSCDAVAAQACVLIEKF